MLSHKFKLSLSSVIFAGAGLFGSIFNTCTFPEFPQIPLPLPSFHKTNGGGDLWVQLKQVCLLHRPFSKREKNWLKWNVHFNRIHAAVKPFMVSVSACKQLMEEKCWPAAVQKDVTSWQWAMKENWNRTPALKKTGPALWLSKNGAFSYFTIWQRGLDLANRKN